MSLELSISGNAFFVSDLHLGIPDKLSSNKREEMFIKWLDEISGSIDHLFLLGDVFDFWFEYKDVVPKGFFRLFSKLYQLKQQGTNIYFFTGNHDMWVKDYLKEELEMIIFNGQQLFEINGKRFMVGHGDGLGKKDVGYKIVKKIFACKLHIFLYGLLHPRIAFGIARFFSKKSRKSSSKIDKKGQDNRLEYMIEESRKKNIDYFIYGHIHLPEHVKLENGAEFFNLGDWLTHNSYVKIEGSNVELSSFKM